MTFRTPLIAALALGMASSAAAENLAQAYTPPGGAQLLPPLRRADPARAVRTMARDLTRASCPPSALVEIRIGGQTLRVPLDHLISVVTDAPPQLSDGCPGSPIPALVTALRVYGQGLPVLIEGSLSNSAFVGPVMSLKNSSTCTPRGGSVVECVLSAENQVWIDRSGPVDQYDNPPFGLAGGNDGLHLLPFAHPSGLFAMTFLPRSEPLDAGRLRGARALMEHAFNLYLARPWSRQAYDPGKIPVDNLGAPDAGVVGYRVDAENWSQGDVLGLRTCASPDAEFQVGPVRFTVPANRLRAFQASPTAMAIGANRKAMDADSSCPGHPLLVSGFRVEVERHVVEVLGRGRMVQTELRPVMERLVATGSCSQTPEGPRRCEVRADGVTQSVYQQEDPEFPATVMCVTPKGERKGCMLGSEVELGFSYGVDMPEKPSATTNWAAEVKLMPDLIRSLKPTAVTVGQAKRTAGASNP